MENNIHFTISAEEKAQIQEALKTIETVLIPKLKTLTVEERKGLLKMGDKTLAFTTKTLDYANSKPEYIPSFMDANEFKVDMEAISELRPIFNSVNLILEALDDSIMLSGSEAYTAALMYYNNVKLGANSNVSGAKSIYEDLKQRFPRRRN